MRRFVMIALSLSLVLGLSATAHLFGQDEKKDAPKADAGKPESPKVEAPKSDTAAPSATAPAAEAPLPPIPPEVEAKLEAARRAVAEAIVAAQDAGLVQTTINPPPILDILVSGRATDERSLKAKTGVSPEVFAAWFTGYGKMEGVVAQTDVRIIPPSQGLKQFYDRRADILNRHIKAIRDQKADAQKARDEAKGKEEAAKKEEVMKEEEAEKKAKEEAVKKGEEAKKDEPKKTDEEKKDEPKKEEEPK
ncbi:MAG: hypothetical protein JO034_17850 [Singulisphaera sp.]|nr:hypothetical protein [Singulisphaera sp.]